MKRHFRGLVGALGAGFVGLWGNFVTVAAVPFEECPAPPRDSATAPNLVVIYADDMGWGDAPGFALEGVEPPAYTRAMPNLARLAREGAVFRHYYTAQPVCSASRAALLTGCYPNRIGIHGALFPDARVGIAREERTLAEMLHDKGYSTAIFGKWHLGHLPEFNPLRHGFDEWFGIPYSNDMWPIGAGRQNLPKLPLMDGEKPVEFIESMDAQATLTRRLTERACGFIEKRAGEKRPFFAYLAHPQPHTPIAAGAAFAPAVRRELYAAVMREIDWSVGEVLAALDRAGVAGETIVLFTSDNGPWLSFGTDAGSSGGLREGKGTCFEGGVREPCFVRWPGHVPAGKASDVPWMSIDLFATMAAIVGAPAPAADRPIDGRDAREIWRCAPDARPSHDAFWFYYHTNHLEAVRMGKWKVSLPRKSRTLDGKPGGVDGGQTPYVEKAEPLALFDLEADPTETTDVSARHPEVMAEIMKHVEAARADLGDALVNREGTGRRAAGRAGGAGG
jgi:arylsulfatase A-like enzyme